jgi:uncharacterized repeat protein (TIGR03803 family)
VVFKVGSAGNETILHTFAGDGDGKFIYTGLVMGSDGSIYGTASEGGDLTCNPPDGCGTVFKLDKAGSFSALHTFENGQDSALPGSGLVLDSAGNLYGTTFGIGSYGTVFKLDQTGTLTVLHTFSGADGFGPWGDLTVDSSGNIYGTTSAGGTGCRPSGCGVVFKITQ